MCVRVASVDLLIVSKQVLQRDVSLSGNLTRSRTQHSSTIIIIDARVYTQQMVAACTSRVME